MSQSPFCGRASSEVSIKTYTLSLSAYSLVPLPILFTEENLTAPEKESLESQDETSPSPPFSRLTSETSRLINLVSCLRPNPLSSGFAPFLSRGKAAEIHDPFPYAH